MATPGNAGEDMYIRASTSVTKVLAVVQKLKQRIRNYIWEVLEKKGIATYPFPPRYKIPSFVGNYNATWKIVRSRMFAEAEVVFSGSNASEKLLREEVLKHGKTLIMATPGLERGFVIVRPEETGLNGRTLLRAASLKYAMRVGRLKDLPSDIRIDLYVISSLAAWVDGSRLGKGGGLPDLEYGVLREAGAVRSDTPVVTLVHDVQLVEGIPMELHDVPVDYIATPTRFIRTQRKYEKPSGIVWELIPKDMAEKIPALRRLAGFL